MEPNIGRINALIRITCGFSVLAWATAQMARKKQSCSTPLLLAVMGSMKVAEGLTRFCPLVYLAQNGKAMQQQDHQQDGRVINPS